MGQGDYGACLGIAKDMVRSGCALKHPAVPFKAAFYVAAVGEHWRFLVSSRCEDFTAAFCASIERPVFPELGELSKEAKYNYVSDLSSALLVLSKTITVDNAILHFCFPLNGAARTAGFPRTLIAHTQISR